MPKPKAENQMKMDPMLENVTKIPQNLHNQQNYSIQYMVKASSKPNPHTGLTHVPTLLQPHRPQQTPPPYQTCQQT